MFRIRSFAAAALAVGLLAAVGTAAVAHEGKGGMHQDCLRHAPPGGYPDCHWHHYNETTNRWEIRRRLLDGRPCPPNDACRYDGSR